MTKARICAELDVVLHTDIDLPATASKFEKQQHKEEVYRIFTSKLKKGFVEDKVNISCFEFELEPDKVISRL